MPLTSFFHQNKSASLLKKSNTMSYKSTTAEPPTLVRSNTFSKVKRLGSLLVRNNNNKKSNPPRVDTIFPSPIDTSLASSYSPSSSSCTHSSSDEDELTTPKDMTFQPLESPTVIENNVVTPKLQTNQIQESTSIKGEQQKHIILSQELDAASQKSQELDTTSQETTLSSTPEIIDPLTLSGVSLVRYHLNLALEIADKEIEQELESHHVQMLHSIT